MGIDSDRMTINGTVGVTALLLFVTVASAAFAWGRLGFGIGIVCAFVAMGLSFVTGFKPDKAPILGIPFAIAEGVFVGVVSNYYNEAYQGIVLTAAGLTIAILFAMLGIYRTGIIPVTRNFQIAVAAGVAGIGLLYLVTFALSFAGIQMPLVQSNSNFGILFTIAVIVLACATLVVNFDFIEKGAEQGAPKYMEWAGAVGLVATIVWLYLELLRLLSKFQSR